MRLALAVLVTVMMSIESCECVLAQAVNDAWLGTELETIKDDLKLVGAGATVLVHGRIIAAAVTGERRQSSDVPLTIDDKWHVGSITKSMTATVIARLVEQGTLRWDATLPDLLPDIAAEFHPSWHDVALHHVLTHTAGLPANFSARTQLSRPGDRDALHAARRQELAAVLVSPPTAEPGEKMIYSNIGYTLAGFIAAEAADTTWETLMERELFTPLKLKSAGFGPPIGEEPLSQPWGHQRVLFMRNPVDPHGLADNTPIMGPAGCVHMSMHDLARYGWEHLRGESSDTGYLRSKTFQTLHDGGRHRYAHGWIDWQRDWADGRVIWHNGSNTLWYALVIMVPSRDAVLVLVTNDGYLSAAEPAFFELAETIVSELPSTSEKGSRQPSCSTGG